MRLADRPFSQQIAVDLVGAGKRQDGHQEHLARVPVSRAMRERKFFDRGRAWCRTRFGDDEGGGLEALRVPFDQNDGSG